MYSKDKRHTESYARFFEVFDADRLPQNHEHYVAYQLIRNVLAAQHRRCAFYLICDARRPDLLRGWWKTHAAIKAPDLWSRCGFFLWQEIAELAPADLQRFLAEKYGIK